MSEKLRLEAFIEATEAIHMLGIVVLKDGQEVARKLWVPEKPRPLFSVTKSFTATAIGLAESEGLVDLDAPVKPYLMEDWPTEKDVTPIGLARLEEVTLRHLITMTHGHDQALLMSEDRSSIAKDQWVRQALKHPLKYLPGDRFVYNNAGPYLAGVVLQNVLQMTMVDYLMPRLFEPLGIPRPEWERDGQGRNFGASGMKLSVTNMARFGQLYLQKGRYNGKELVPESWVEASTKNQLKGHKAPYGLGFWLGPDKTFRADGKYSQYVIVAPNRHMVVAIMAWNDRGVDMLEIINQHLIHCT